MRMNLGTNLTQSKLFVAASLLAFFASVVIGGDALPGD